MIPHCLPWPATNEKRNVRAVLASRRLVRGHFLDKVKVSLERMCGGHVALVSSGTAGLHLALIRAGVKPGEPINVPALTYIGTINPILLCGAVPVFRDIEPDTWGLAAGWPERTLPAHLYGARCRADAEVEDACEALGAWSLRGRFGVLSFNQNKIVTAGGGGAVVCRDKADADWIQSTVDDHRAPGTAYVWTEMGHPYFMTNLQAAILDAQLDDLPTIMRRKRAIAMRYTAAFPQINWLVNLTAWQPVGLAPVPAAELVRRCQAAGVEVRHVWPCLPDLPLFRDHGDGAFPVARNVAKYGISLPCSPQLTPKDQGIVIRTVNKILAELKNSVV